MIAVTQNYKNTIHNFTILFLIRNYIFLQLLTNKRDRFERKIVPRNSLDEILFFPTILFLAKLLIKTHTFASMFDVILSVNVVCLVNLILV